MLIKLRHDSFVWPLNYILRSNKRIVTDFNQQEQVRLYLDNIYVTCNEHLLITSKNMYSHYLNDDDFKNLSILVHAAKDVRMK